MASAVKGSPQGAVDESGGGGGRDKLRLLQSGCKEEEAA